MDERESGLHLDRQQTENVIKRLEDIRDKLAVANERLGYMARFNAIKQEIRELGWTGVCTKYHPDINIGDPAAHEVFQLYKFVYANMDR